MLRYNYSRHFYIVCRVFRLMCTSHTQCNIETLYDSSPVKENVFQFLFQAEKPNELMFQSLLPICILTNVSIA